MKLEGKTILVTGSRLGIGRETALQLARDIAISDSMMMSRLGAHIRILLFCLALL